MSPAFKKIHALPEAKAHRQAAMRYGNSRRQFGATSIPTLIAAEQLYSTAFALQKAAAKALKGMIK